MSASRNSRRTLRRGIAVLAIGYAVVVSAGWMTPSTPFDGVLNLPPVELDDALRCRAVRPQLVVLQHGICRSAWSLWRLERALRAHGYEVLNPGYPSTKATIEEHAARLERAIEGRLAGREVLPEISFVGHSMGGLVIRSYLGRANARPARSCVFVATPQRGAALSTVRSRLFVYGLFMGSKAGLQLVPGHPFYDTLGPVPAEHVGCLYGGAGDDMGWNDDVPGDDDMTVATDEVQLPEQTDALRLPYGHTRISMHDDTIRQVLAFLRDGAFDR